MNPADVGGRNGVAGEPADLWEQEIRELRQAVHLWDLAKRGDTAGLERCIGWGSEDGGAAVYYTPPLDLFPEIPEPARGLLYAENTLIAGPAFHPELLARFRPGEPTGPALAYMQRQVNKRLETHTRVRMETDDSTAEPAVTVVPCNLGGAIWLQFAQAVGENKTHRRCRECSEWFEVVRDGGRVTRQFCSNACRSKAYRERQDRARRMHAAGAQYPEIAEALESDVATVRGWVEGDKS